MKELTLAATLENIEKVTDFVNTELLGLSCSEKAQTLINIAIDEIFSNIAYYAYVPNAGKVTVRINFVDDPLSAVITFIDRGLPYNPLAKEDPDTTLPTDKRKPGGFGIFMVKNSMDAMEYEYCDGQNILSIKKSLA